MYSPCTSAESLGVGKKLLNVGGVVTLWLVCWTLDREDRKVWV